METSVNQHCIDHDIPAQMKRVGSMFHMFFQAEVVNSMRDVRGDYLAAQKAFYLHCLNRGVLVPGTQRAFLSAAHGEEEIDTLVRVFNDSLTDVQAEGLFG